jgi:KDO2-lipid IV(A) lauroyltransferase
MVKPLHIVEFVAFQFIASLVQLLPLSAVRKMGRGLGRFVFVRIRYRRDVTLNNLRRAFPEKSETELILIAQGAFENIGISLLELVWFPRMTPEKILEEMRFDKPDVLQNAYKKGRGVIILTAHFGNWELLGQALTARFQYPLSGLAKTQSNHLVNEQINRRRKLFGTKVIPMETSLREVIRALGDGEMVAIAADQAAPKENVSVKFFGTMVPTHTGPSILSLKMGSAILAIFAVRSSDGSYDAHMIEVPSEDLKGHSDENVIELTRRHVKITENIIRQYPDQWLWMHKRWKHVPLPESHSEEAGT